MANEISVDISENVTTVEVSEDVTTVNIAPVVTTVEVRGISITDAGNASAMSYTGNTNLNLAVGSTVGDALNHINVNGLNKNSDQTIDGNITFAEGHSITFTTSSSAITALDLNNNNLNLGGKMTWQKRLILD